MNAAELLVQRPLQHQHRLRHRPPRLTPPLRLCQPASLLPPLPKLKSTFHGTLRPTRSALPDIASIVAAFRLLLLPARAIKTPAFPPARATPIPLPPMTPPGMFLPNQ